MSYNIDFDLAAIVIASMIAILFYSKKYAFNLQNTTFACMLWTALLTPISDIAAIYAIEEFWSDEAVIFWNTVYYICKSGVIFFFLAHLLATFEMRKYFSKIKICIMYLPIIVVWVGVLLNLYTGWLFTYEDNVFTSGPFRTILYGVSIFYFAFALAYTAYNAKKLRKRYVTLVLAICGINIILQLIQLYIPYVMLLSFGASLSLVLILMNMENKGTAIDPSTGLAGRNYFLDTCEKFINNEHAFKMVLVKALDYDMLISNIGNDKIEKMMVSMGKYLSAYARTGSGFRISRNCFALIVENFENINYIDAIYARLTDNWNVEGFGYLTNISITIVDFPTNFKDYPSLMNYLACFQNLDDTKSGILEAEELKVRDNAREKEVKEAIKRALESDGFEMYYQPICVSNTKKFVTAEALIRLNDSELGFISPAEFIPIAENTGLILEIGKYVVDTVCKFIKNHDMQELGLNYIELNLSAWQCLQPGFVEDIEKTVTQYGIAPDELCFEITETATTRAPVLLSENLKKLSDKGHLLALDDFGTGYSNLQRMIDSAFDIIKFDRDTVEKLTGDDNLHDLFKNQLDMMHSLGAKVVSEGVETKEQYDFINEAGGDFIQGYYFSRPVPENEFCRFLSEN